MSFYSLRILAVGLLPIAVSACAEIEAATAQPTSVAPSVGVDLGHSSRVPQIAGMAGEGEGFGRTEPEPGATPSPHGSMPGMAHGTTPMEDGSMPGMDHGSMQMDHGSMPAGSHGSTRVNRGVRSAMPGMGHGTQEKMASAHGPMTGTKHGSPNAGMQMAHSGHGDAQGTGTVNSVNAAGHKINVSHGPISAIGLPAMTMDFAVSSSVDLSTVQPGSRIKFTIEQEQGGSYVIQSITPTEGARK